MVIVLQVNSLMTISCGYDEKDGNIGVVSDTIRALLNDVIDEVAITKGAMILDGYNEEDSCIHYMNGLIKELSSLNRKINK